MKKKVIYAVAATIFSAILMYYILVMYYAFIDARPWGVERYLSLRGLKGVRVDDCWRIESLHCAKPSKLIGEFSKYTSINVCCKEFDVSDIADCDRLEFLDVQDGGVIKNIELLKDMNVLFVSGYVNEPITDIALLSIIKRRGWHIGLIATVDTAARACTCPESELYSGLWFDIAAFHNVSRDDICNLRKQKFCGINSTRPDCFWRTFDAGVFSHGIDCYDIRSGAIKKISEQKAVEIEQAAFDAGELDSHAEEADETGASGRQDKRKP